MGPTNWVKPVAPPLAVGVWCLIVQTVQTGSLQSCRHCSVQHMWVSSQWIYERFYFSFFFLTLFFKPLLVFFLVLVLIFGLSVFAQTYCCVNALRSTWRCERRNAFLTGRPCSLKWKPEPGLWMSFYRFVCLCAQPLQTRWYWRRGHVAVIGSTWILQEVKHPRHSLTSFTRWSFI